MLTFNKKAHATLTGALALGAALLPGAYAQDAPTTPDTTAGAVDVPAASMPEATPQATPVTEEGADPPKSRGFRLGPEVGLYFPTNSRTRDRFGDAWLSLGLGFGPISGITSKGQLGFDLSLNYQQHNGNRVLLLPVGLGYRVALTQNPEAKTIPYAGVTGDVYLADVSAPVDNVHSGLRAGGGGSVLLGVNFGQTGNLEARYQFVSHIQSFDFSGLSLRAGYRF